MLSKTSSAKQKASAKRPKKEEAPAATDQGQPSTFKLENLLNDPETFARNASETVNHLNHIAKAMLQRIDERGAEPDTGDRFQDFFSTLAAVGKHWIATPEKTLEAQSRITGQYLTLWSQSMRRFAGEDAERVVEPEPNDKRFVDDQWNENPVFDFLKQAYLITANWADEMVAEADTLDEHTKRKAKFYVTQVMNAASPTNFAGTNPEVLRETLEKKGKNLAKGMKMLAEDVKAGNGTVKMRQSHPNAFKVGENLATTKGNVVFQNEICQLIQYSPTTEMVRKRPLLIIPPWINKYYILDLTQEKSLIKWLVDQGHTVFIVSWVDPGPELANAGWDTYMNKGIFDTLDVVSAICSDTKIDLAGYCVGGTLASIALAHMAKRGDDRVASATFFTTQVDFKHAGDLLVFIDEGQLGSLEKVMENRGFLDANRMATTFNLLRSNDLFWSYAVNNYLKGKQPRAFDLLHWNSDNTRMTPKNHSFYLRHLYMLNDITEGRMRLAGQAIDLAQIKIPVFTLATREDHIAPAKSVLRGSTFYGGPVEFVLAGSGHIAGVINPPQKNRYGYMKDGEIIGRNGDIEHWQNTATSHEGSWWPYWDQWLRKLDDTKTKARKVGSKDYPAIENAPGSYVKSFGVKKTRKNID